MVEIWIGQTERVCKPGHGHFGLEITPIALERDGARIDGSLISLPGAQIADFSAYHSHALYPWPIHYEARRIIFEWLFSIKEGTNENNG